MSPLRPARPHAPSQLNGTAAASSSSASSSSASSDGRQSVLVSPSHKRRAAVFGSLPTESSDPLAARRTFGAAGVAAAEGRAILALLASTPTPTRGAGTPAHTAAATTAPAAVAASASASASASSSSEPWRYAPSREGRDTLLGRTPSLYQFIDQESAVVPAATAAPAAAPAPAPAPPAAAPLADIAWSQLPPPTSLAGPIRAQFMYDADADLDGEREYVYAAAANDDWDEDEGEGEGGEERSRAATEEDKGSDDDEDDEDVEVEEYTEDDADDYPAAEQQEDHREAYPLAHAQVEPAAESASSAAAAICADTELEEAVLGPAAVVPGGQRAHEGTKRSAGDLAAEAGGDAGWSPYSSAGEPAQQRQKLTLSDDCEDLRPSDPVTAEVWDARMRQADAAVCEVFGAPGYKPGQRRAVAAVLARRDGLVVLPTGGGKSLVFLMAAVLLPGVTVVIVPMISLINDLAKRAKELGLPTEVLTSEIGEEVTVIRHLNAIRLRLKPEQRGPTVQYVDGKPKWSWQEPLKILLTTPETFSSKKGVLESLKWMATAGLFSSLFVDEAHMLVTWGRSFRPAMASLGLARFLYPSVSVTAVTATATPTMQAGILKLLRMQTPGVVRTMYSPNRPNLRIDVIQSKTLHEQMRKHARDLEGADAAPGAASSASSGAAAASRPGVLTAAQVDQLVTEASCKSSESTSNPAAGMALRWILQSPYPVQAGESRSSAPMTTRAASGDWLRHTGIIYCGSRKLCETVAARLNAQLGPLYAAAQREHADDCGWAPEGEDADKGTSAGATATAATGLQRSAYAYCTTYHSGIEDEDEKKARVVQWKAGRVKVMVATTAFGAGIDHPSVRWVLQLSIPRSLADYFQETGRAGRDGAPAQCALIVDWDDTKRLRNMVEKDAAQVAINLIAAGTEALEQQQKLAATDGSQQGSATSGSSQARPQQSALQRLVQSALTSSSSSSFQGAASATSGSASAASSASPVSLAADVLELLQPPKPLDVVTAEAAAAAAAARHTLFSEVRDMLLWAHESCSCRRISLLQYFDSGEVVTSATSAWSSGADSGLWKPCYACCDSCEYRLRAEGKRVRLQSKYLPAVTATAAAHHDDDDDDDDAYGGSNKPAAKWVDIHSPTLALDCSGHAGLLIVCVAAGEKAGYPFTLRLAAAAAAQLATAHVPKPKRGKPSSDDTAAHEDDSTTGAAARAATDIDTSGGAVDASRRGLRTATSMEELLPTAAAAAAAAPAAAAHDPAVALAAALRLPLLPEAVWMRVAQQLVMRGHLYIQDEPNIGRKTSDDHLSMVRTYLETKRTEASTRTGVRGKEASDARKAVDADDDDAAAAAVPVPLAGPKAQAARAGAYTSERVHMYNSAKPLLERVLQPILPHAASSLRASATAAAAAASPAAAVAPFIVHVRATELAATLEAGAPVAREASSSSSGAAAAATATAATAAQSSSSSSGGGAAGGATGRRHKGPKAPPPPPPRYLPQPAAMMCKPVQPARMTDMVEGRATAAVSWLEAAAAARARARAAAALAASATSASSASSSAGGKRAAISKGKGSSSGSSKAGGSGSGGALSSSKQR